MHLSNKIPIASSFPDIRTEKKITFLVCLVFRIKSLKLSNTLVWTTRKMQGTYYQLIRDNFRMFPFLSHKTYKNCRKKIMSGGRTDFHGAHNFPLNEFTKQIGKLLSYNLLSTYLTMILGM